MFKYFPIFYYPEEGGYGGNQQGGGQEGSENTEEKSSSSSEESSGGESESGNTGTAVNFKVSTDIQSDTPNSREAVAGDGEKYLRVQPYQGLPSQQSRLQRFGAPPPPGLPKHIQLTAGPYYPSSTSFGQSNTSSYGAFVRIYVNVYVTAEDFSTGSLTIDSAFDSVVSLSDITPINSPGAPYWTGSQTNYDVDHHDLDAVTLSIASGSEQYDSAALASNQLYLEYENNGAALPTKPFRRLIQVTWASGDTKDFQMLLPGNDWLTAAMQSGVGGNQSYTNLHRADGCVGDGTTSPPQPHTSVSRNTMFASGGGGGSFGQGGGTNMQYEGFFKIVEANNTGAPSGLFNDPNFNSLAYRDYSFDSNESFNIGALGNQEEDFTGEQYYKGIIGNFNGLSGADGYSDAHQWNLANIGSQNAYDFAVSHLDTPIYVTPPQAFGPDASGGTDFTFADVHVYSKDMPDCTSVPPPVSFDACTNPQSSVWFQYTGVDCASNNLLAFGNPAINYVANPTLASWNNGACCPDCNGLSITATVKDVTTLGGNDGAIEFTVLDGGFAGATPTGNGYGVGGFGTAFGNETGTGRYAYTIVALSSQSIGGLGNNGTLGNTVGYGYATHPQGINQNVNTFTVGHQLDLVQDGLTTPQSTAFTGSTALTVTLNGVTQTLIPAHTHNGTMSTGLVAGCYKIYVKDEAVNPLSNTLIQPCWEFIDVCIQDGVGVMGCTDNSANTNDGIALNYNPNAVVDDGSCLYCNANNGTLIDATSNLAPTAGEIANSGVNSFTSTPTIRTNSNDGQIALTNISATSLFQQFINNVVDSNGLNNAAFTLQFYKTSNRVDWDAAQISLTPNSLTNFATVGSLYNNGAGQWQGTFNTTNLGANINYGYYAVKLAISDPDAVVEIEECYQVFYFVIPVNVCVDPGGQFATALTNTNTPPGTLVIPVSEDILWYSNPSICTALNTYCCQQPTLTNPSGPCQTNELVADFNCDPTPSLLSFELQYDNSGSWVTVNTNTHVPTGQFYTFTYTQGATVTSTNFVDDGFYRLVLTSSYTNSADCTKTSATIQITSDIFGCTDSTALNYNPLATCNQGCIYCIYGCMDASAINYDPLATCDDGSCITPILGCTDPTALNYDPNANTNNGSCIYGTYGCTDPVAYNYNRNCNNQVVVATVDDGCCFYPCSPQIQPAPSTFVTTDATGACVGSNADGSITVTTFFTSGAMSGQTKTIEYFTNAGVSVFADPTVHSNATSPNHFNTFTYSQFTSGVYYFVITDNFGCQETQSFSISSASVQCGCTDPNAGNYDPTATLDDGSCLYGGCIDPNALNFNINAAFDDGSCTYPPVISPCVPSNTNSLISLLEACIAKNGFQYYNKLVTGQADDCSTMNAWKVILIEYLISKRGSKCIYNCADMSTANPSSLTTCSSKWIIGGPKTGSNDQAFAGSIVNPGQGTTITDPSLYFVVGNTLFLGDVIKMPSGNIYEVVPPTSNCTFGCYSPETSQGAHSGHWQQCVAGLQISSFPNNVNYLDKFNTFVAKFCVDCNIVDENVIKNPKNLSPSTRGRTRGLSIDGINGLEI